MAWRCPPESDANHLVDAIEPISCSQLTMSGWTQDRALESIQDSVRDLDILELFSGVSSIVKAGAKAGLQSEGYDVLDGQTPDAMDVTTPTGFATALAKVGRIKQGGLCSAAPKCSSWVWTNSSGHKRSAANDYYGDTTQWYVKEGNTIALATLFLLQVAKARRCEPIVENPPASALWKWPPFKLALRDLGMCHDVITYRCAFSREPFGKRYLKAFKFAACGDWIKAIRRTCSCPKKIHLQLCMGFIQKMTPRKPKHVGKRRFTGRKSHLESSGAYPPLLGECIVNAYLNGCGRHGFRHRQDVDNVINVTAAEPSWAYLDASDSDDCEHQVFDWQQPSP